MQSREAELIPYGERKRVTLPVRSAAFFAGFLRTGASEVGNFMVDRGQRGVELAERIENAELQQDQPEAVVLIDQMDIIAMSGIVRLTGAVQSLKLEQDPKKTKRVRKAVVIFDSVLNQVTGQN